MILSISYSENNGPNNIALSYCPRDLKSFLMNQNNSEVTYSAKPKISGSTKEEMLLSPFQVYLTFHSEHDSTPVAKK